MKDRDIEFIPTDELVEEEAADPEDEAADAEDVEQLAGLEATQAENSAAEEREEAEPDKLAAEPVEAPIDIEAIEAEEEEHEDDLGEILRRHFGIEEEEDQDEFALGEGELRAGRPKEFLCRACFLLKPTSQLADAAQSICRDCAANRA
jgi:hypothetical protein